MKVIISFLVIANTMAAFEVKHFFNPTTEQIDGIQQFYDECGYTGRVASSDKIIVAMQNADIIGVVRLCIEEKKQVLRGMQIHKAYQRQGIGKKLLNEINITINNCQCWLIAYDWVEPFYSAIDFIKIDEREAPLFLEERVKKYRTENPTIGYIIMVKN